MYFDLKRRISSSGHASRVLLASIFAHIYVGRIELQDGRGLERRPTFDPKDWQDAQESLARRPAGDQRFGKKPSGLARRPVRESDEREGWEVGKHKASRDKNALFGRDNIPCMVLS